MNITANPPVHTGGSPSSGLLTRNYIRILGWSLRHRWVIVLATVLTFLSTPVLFMMVGSDFVPKDDQSEFEISMILKEGTTLKQAEEICIELEPRLKQVRGVTNVFTVIGPSDGKSPKGQGDVTLVNIYCRMTDLRERDFSQRAAMADARAIMADYPDIRAAVQDVNIFSSSAFKNAQLDVSLRGPEASCATAKSVLEQLYARLSQGEMIGVGEVVGAIRHARTEEPDGEEPSGELPQAQQIRTRKRLITARTPAQSAYLASLQRNDLVFATGPAGTGKTYLAVAFAAACLESGRCDRLILSRPAVEAGERLGFLPGDMREKVDPYLRPLYDALYDVLPPDRVERGMASGVIEIAPLAFMRGRTLSHAIIILDEAQNCTPVQLKMFLTRLGDESKMIVTGDPTQVDLPPGKDSGLLEAIKLLRGIEEVDHIAFTRADVVRRELVGKIVDAYESAPRKGERHG